MGSPSSETGRRRTEGPQHLVEVEGFSIGKFEITYAEYDAFTNKTGREKINPSVDNRESKPVTDVSYDDTIAYITWLSNETGEIYRLPTSAQWEYAARAGSTSSYPWGDEIGKNMANCRGCGSRWDALGTAPVGAFAPNAWGIHDTVGNVWEWTCSKLELKYCGEEKICASTDKESTQFVTRGGGYRHHKHKVRSAFYHGLPLTSFPFDLGFRVVRDN